ncbi:hypothetical protein [Ectopseudomonas alcaliphila]|uniref:Uncharacterized protein n=1 Tax=Ectopseudomonas alcaliphila TaxID=101564 RepID=A0A1G7EB86_9GAMM|nr:hypothetical protein [Pseudomonas alcaliphila]MDX5990771.1 hypothetical protein [Pseudomonas alcaliphila]SDE60860.1 hypothetical protein SAMN05216575_103266 [Pseudomonas alcaliphila]
MTTEALHADRDSCRDQVEQPDAQACTTHNFMLRGVAGGHAKLMLAHAVGDL